MKTQSDTVREQNQLFWRQRRATDGVLAADMAAVSMTEGGDINMGMSGDGPRIRAARVKRGMSQRQLGEVIGVSQASIDKIESGQTVKSKYLNELLIFLGLKEGRTSVPLVGYVSAGIADVIYGDGQGPYELVPGPPDANPRTVAVLARGASLGPFFADWYVYYDDVRTPPTNDLMGRLCVVGLGDGRVVIKVINAAAKAGLYHLIPQMGPPTLDVPVVWATPVKFMSPSGAYRS